MPNMITLGQNMKEELAIPASSDWRTDGWDYNSFLVYCRELTPGTVSVTGDRAQGNDSKYDSHYNCNISDSFFQKRGYKNNINVFMF